jgi:hypothetical protein
MSNSPKRIHLETLMGKDPETNKAFARICALLMATKAKDLECDIVFGDRQYHFDVSEVTKLANQGVLPKKEDV